MDTSLEYIKMCGEAVKDLDKHQLREGDFYVLGQEIQVAYDMDNWTGNVEIPREFGQPVWLPRQDQLQEMVKDIPRPVHPFWQVQRFASFIMWDKVFVKIRSELSPVVSMEQIWLAYVMILKFDKVWDGETWQNLKTATPA